MSLPTLEHRISLPLKHRGDCSLLGVEAVTADDGSETFTLYVEEIYGDEGWLAQHMLTLDGQLLASIDEAAGENDSVRPLKLPEGAATPKTGWHTMGLNFSGPRHRGLRGPEHVIDLVRSLALQDKLALIERLKLDVLPPALLGLAESYVLSEAQFGPLQYFVCQRVRLALALPEERLDDDNLPYDYDTLVVYCAHFVDLAQANDLPLIDALEPPPGVNLRRPMDCLYFGDHLFLADGSAPDDTQPSAVHVWRVIQPARPANDDRAEHVYQP